MGIERVEKIMCKHMQAYNVLTYRSPPRFMCIALHQFAKLKDNHSFTQVHNCLKFVKNEKGVQCVEAILPLLFV